MKTKGKIPLNALSFLMGGINGLLGAGGGILAVVLLERVKKLPPQKAHATALIIMLPLSVISIVVYWLKGSVELGPILPVTLGMLPGSIAGAKLLGKVKGKHINKIFAIVLLAAGVRMIIG